MSRFRVQVTRFAAIGFLALWADLSLGHLAGGFRHPGMWVPLITLPIAAAVCEWTVRSPAAASHRALRLMSCAAILIGMLGSTLHLLRLVSDLRGPIQFDVLLRLMRYPPLLAPLAVSGLGILGLLIGSEEGEGEEG